MNPPKILKNWLCSLLLMGLCCHGAIAQKVQINGTVYDRTQQYPLRGVSVMGTSGVGTVTDSLGHYKIQLNNSDSIYFSYLQKATQKVPVKEIGYPSQFDMSLDAGVDSLPLVMVWSRNYHMDSLENRLEYQKVFDYGGADYIDNMKTGRGKGLGVSLNFDMFFEGRQNRRMLAFQHRLVQEEQDKYIDHRFTKALVKKLTGMQPPALDSFIRQYRPGYDFLKSFTTDWEYYQYVQEAGRNYMEMWKQDSRNPDSKD